METTVNESHESSGSRPRNAPCERVRKRGEADDQLHQEGQDEESEADLNELWWGDLFDELLDDLDDE